MEFINFCTKSAYLAHCGGGEEGEKGVEMSGLFEY
jgi:hypothetical protein